MWMPCTVWCRSREVAQPLRSTVPQSVPAHSAAYEMKPIGGGYEVHAVLCCPQHGSGNLLTGVQAEFTLISRNCFGVTAYHRGRPRWYAACAATHRDTSSAR